MNSSQPLPLPSPNPLNKKCNKNSTKSIKLKTAAALTESKMESKKSPKATKESKDNIIDNISSSMPQPICDGRCLAERRIHCREMGKWGRQMLTLVGLENVFQRAIGATHWRRFNRSIKKSISNPVDFPTNEPTCNWCFGLRIGAIDHDCCPTMNETLLKGGIVEANQMEGTIPSNNSNVSPASSSSTASSPGSSIPAPKLFPSFYFNPLQSNDHPPSQSLLRQSASSSSLPSPPKATNAESISSNSNAFLPPDSPFARFLSMHQNTQNQGQMSPTMAAERMAISTAAMQFMAAAASGGAAGNGQNGANAAFLPSLFTSSLYSYWPFSTAMGQHFAALFAQQNGQNGSSNGENGGNNSPGSPTTPTNSISNFDLQQQFALAWQSQMLAAFGLLGGLNAPAGANIGREQLTPSEDEALALLLGQRQKTPPENDSGKKGGAGDEEPLDLSAKSWPKMKMQGKERGIKRNNSGKIVEMEEAPKLVKNESSESLQGFDEEFEGMEEMGTEQNLMMEDGSEAESPKLGTKRAYTQANLDAAISDIRLRRLGTRRASCVYGIPRSTLRNKIYKLLAAEDLNGGNGEGEGVMKRRRLRAIGGQRNEQRLAKETMEKLEAVEEEKSGNGGKMGEGENGDMKGGIGQNQIGNKNEYLPMTEGSFASTAQKLFKQLSGQIGQFVGQFQEPKRKIQKTEKMAMENGERGQKEEATPKSPLELDKGQKDKDKVHRPKRGQYRKYEKDALDKAVAAVRNGEMSVHRAGSHFGVPHSTLEYKVKERNLLRTKSKKQLLHFHSSGALPIPRNSSLSPQIVRQSPSALSLQTNSASSSPPYTPTTEEARIVLTKMLNSIVGEDT